MLFDDLNETSIAFIALSEWLPGIFTVLVGGYLVSVLFPRLQKGFQKTQQQEERKRQIAEDVLQSFNRYITAWRRLIAIARLEEERGLTEVELDRKRSFAKDRNDQRDDLVDKLRLCELYYSGRVCSEIDQFLKWDERQTTKTLDDLPDISEWRSFERKMVDCIKNELVN